jgi:uncharacterized protein (TIGR03437 family)
MVAVTISSGDGSVRRSRRGYAGLDQVNVLVPRDLIGKGEVPIVLMVDGKQANSVTVAFK